MMNGVKESSSVAAFIATTIGGWRDFYAVWQLYTKEDLSEAKDDHKTDPCMKQRIRSLN